MPKSSMGRDTVHGHQQTGTVDPNKLDETDLANERHGNNRLQGDDQLNVRNQRLATPQVAGATGKAPLEADAPEEKATDDKSGT